jgi:hypothetical protein
VTPAIHIFKPGRHTAMGGATLDFSEADIQASAAAYDPAKHEAPIVVGHPKLDAPAYGWVQSLEALNDGLSATPHQLDPNFAELVTKGRFKKISASFYAPDAPSNPAPGVWYLRHVGFLGAQPPAVKGLKAVAFAEAEEGVVEFADWGQELNAGLWRRLREWLLAKFGEEAADQVVPNWEIESIRDEARQEAPAPAALPAFTEPEESVVTPEEKAALDAELSSLKSKLAAAEAEKKAAAAARRHGEHTAFAEDIVKGGRLAPKHKAAVVAFLDFADGEAAVEFSEGDVKQSLASAFKTFIGELPKVVEFGELATKGKVQGQGHAADVAEFAEKGADPDRLALHSRASALAAEKSIPYAQAARHLISQGA